MVNVFGHGKKFDSLYCFSSYPHVNLVNLWFEAGFPNNVKTTHEAVAAPRAEFQDITDKQGLHYTFECGTWNKICF